MIDFHCHLDLYPDPLAVKVECERRGLYLLSVTTTPSAWRKTADLSSSAKRIRTALGLHPQIAYERLSELPMFDELLTEAHFVGEVGLDGSPELRSTWSAQMHVFEHILGECSDAGGRIMSVHSKRAAAATLDALDRFPAAGIPVLHWFSGSLRDLDRAIKRGWWFSVGPAMLSSQNGRNLAARMPRERVLTESDGPFAQIDGQAVIPWAVESAISILSELWSLSESVTDSLIHENFRRLCGPLNPTETTRKES